MENEKIKKICIKNFRGINSIELDHCKLLNIIVGKNNTCKTSILEAIEFLEFPIDIHKQGKIISRTSYSKIKSTLLENFLHAFTMKNIDCPIEISMHNSRDYKLKISGKVEEGYRPSKLKLEYYRLLKRYQFKESKNDKIFDSFFSFRLNQLLEEVDFPIEKYKTFLKEESYFEFFKELATYINDEEKFTKYKFEYNYNGDIYNRTIYDQSKYNKIDSDSIINFLNIVYSNPLDYMLIDNFYSDIDSIIKNGYKEEIIKLLQIFEENLKDFNILSSGEIICNLNNDGYLNIQSFGDGFKKVLILFAKLISAKNGILLIDEIETGIHHSKINEIYKVLFDIALINNTQIFLTTHNLETVSAFLNVLNENLNQIEIYRIENYKTKKIARNISGEKAYELVIESGGDLR